MPYLRIDVAGPLEGVTRRELLSRTAATFAEVVDAPLERVRTQVLEYPADGFAVGGVTVADSGEQAPMIWVQMMEGRPPDRYRVLITRLSADVADVLGIALDRIRVLITEIRPDLWGIAGRPAPDVRAGEIAARRGDGAP